MPRRTTCRRIGVPDAFRRLAMHAEDLAGLPLFRVTRVSTAAQGAATRPIEAAELHALPALAATAGHAGSGRMAALRAGSSHSRTAPVCLNDDAGARRDRRGDGRRGPRRGGGNVGPGTPR